MDQVQSEVLDIFTRTGALLRGHFVLRSGLHSGHFFQCAQVCQNMGAVSRLTELLLPRIAHLEFDTILAPAMGGLVIGQEVARQTDKRYVFAEKVDDRLAIRRGFKFSEGERVLVVEDVITRGGRVNEALNLIEQHGGKAVGVAILVDRSEGNATFHVPAISLLEMSFPTYQPDRIPADLATIPVSKPGS